MDADAQLAQYFAGMWPHLDEHARRLVAASQAVELGYGGIFAGQPRLRPVARHVDQGH